MENFDRKTTTTTKNNIRCASSQISNSVAKNPTTVDLS